eukprot:TRINITY_DN33150_c0_g1_i1.p1 TRINITY_DN33150_c0_g1~~TRINITY_DN33150_c0_g1_i1.p1  ORF type:complete len:307 (-),score=48.59 TRINITY_DN33150_c0_g1_i1:30-950(-)
MTSWGIKCTLCWTAFALIWILEIAIHVRCGLREDLFEAAEDCIQYPSWGVWVAFSEGLCRSGMIVCMSSFLWESAALVWAHELTDKLRDLHDDAGTFLLLALVASSAFVATLGLWGILAEEAPFWVLLVGHVADIFCHSVIAAALVGTAFESLLAVKERRGGQFMLRFLLCKDSMEAHGVTENSHEDEDQSGKGPGCLKTSILWCVFLLAVWTHSRRYWGGQVPEIMALALDAAGVSCWGGILWWLMQKVLGLGQAAALASGKSDNPYKPSFDDTDVARATSSSVRAAAVGKASVDETEFSGRTAL